LVSNTTAPSNKPELLVNGSRSNVSDVPVLNLNSTLIRNLSETLTNISKSLNITAVNVTMKFSPVVPLNGSSALPKASSTPSPSANISLTAATQTPSPINKTAINITPAPTSSKVSPASGIATQVPSGSSAPNRNGPFLNTPIIGQSTVLPTVNPEDCNVTLDVNGRPVRPSTVATPVFPTKVIRPNNSPQVEVLTPPSPKKVVAVADKKRVVNSNDEVVKSSTESFDHEVEKMVKSGVSREEAFKVINAETKVTSANSHNEEVLKITSASSSQHETQREGVKASSPSPSHHEVVKVVSVGSPDEEIVKVVSVGSTSYKKVRHELPLVKEAKRSKMCFECESRERNQTLGCDEGQVIVSVLASSFGHPHGSCYEPQLWRSNAQCHMDVLSRIAPKCLGKSACDVAADKEYFGSPCAGEEFRLVVNYACAHRKFVLDYEPYEALPEKYQLKGNDNHANVHGKEYHSKEYHSGKGKDHKLGGGNKGKNVGSVHGNGTEDGKYVLNATFTEKGYNASHLSSNVNYSRNDLARYNVSGVGILRGKSNSASSLSVFIAVIATICMAFLQI
jgi:hypothetical protein